MEVLDRLELSGDETAIDAGCGSGRVTAELLERLPEGRVIAVDGSAAMVAKAKERLGDRAAYLVADLAELELEEPVDLIFSTATFHWITDHERLFARLHAALRPGGPSDRPVRRRGQRRRARAKCIAAAAARARIRAVTSRGRQRCGTSPARADRRAAACTRASRRHGAGWSPSRCAGRPLEFTSTATLGPTSRTAARGPAAPVRRGGPRPLGEALDPRLRPPQHRGPRPRSEFGSHAVECRADERFAPHRPAARRRDRPGDRRRGASGCSRRWATSSSSEQLMGGCSIDAHGTALTDEVLAACRERRRGAARRSRRAQMGHDRSRRAAARAGPARPAQGHGPLRQPAAGAAEPGPRSAPARCARSGSRAPTCWSCAS